MDKAKNLEERKARDFEVKEVKKWKGLQPPPLLSSRCVCGDDGEDVR
jgi:hypothetical protein